jgi:hypothetical protein
MKRLVLACLFGALAMPVHAMQQTPPPPASPPAAPAAQQGRGGRGAAPTPAETGAPGQQGGRGANGRMSQTPRWDSASLQNVRIEVTLTDSLPGDASGKKSVSMIVVDDNSGAIRSQGPNSGIQLNVDAEPHIRPDGKIYLSLAIFYVPDAVVSGSSRVAGATLNESVSVIVNDGKPMVVSQSADPRGDRKVTVEVMATVVK